MTDAGAPRPRGRHASPDDVSGVPTSWMPSAAPGPVAGRWVADTPAWDSVPAPRASFSDRDEGTAAWRPARSARWRDDLPRASTGGMRRVSGLLDRDAEDTGPVPVEWRHRGDGGDRSDPRPSPRDLPSSWGGHRDDDFGRHPSAPLPPPPPGAWSRLSRHGSAADDTPTEIVPLPQDDAVAPDDAATDAHALGPHAWDDQTGGLEVIGANVDEELPRRGRRRRAEGEDDAHDVHEDDLDDEALYEDDLHDDLHDEALHELDLRDDLYDEALHEEDLHEDDLPDLPDEEIPLKPYDPRSGRRRRRRRPLAVFLALLVLAALAGGVVFGGQKLLGLFVAEDYPGQGSGSVDIRVQSGDTLSDIGRSLVEADVIASVGPFVDAAEAEPDAMGIAAGVYQMHKRMSGAAALDLLLDPASRQVSRVTIPEGLTLVGTLQRIADATGTPLADLQAAAADPAALGLPAYANGQLEGFLFPATYDVEPGETAVDVLRGMVAQFVEVAGRLQLEQRAAAVGRSPFEVVIVASMIQSETKLDAERPDVAQVIYNRLQQGTPLGIDATLAYGLNKNGNDLTVTDLQSDNPYNTRTRVGLPPTPISAPGEGSLAAALSPSTGDYLYYVLQSQDGSHFFTGNYAEFEAARERCAAAGLGCGG